MASHNKYTVGYCNPYGNVTVLSMRICKIDGWQDIIKLMIGFLMSPGEKERTQYLPDNQPRWKDTTINWILQFMGMWMQNKYMR